MAKTMSSPFAAIPGTDAGIIPDSSGTTTLAANNASGVSGTATARASGSDGSGASGSNGGGRC